MWILFFLIHIIFILYFAAIGVWWLGLVPLIMMIVLLLWGEKWESWEPEGVLQMNQSTFTLEWFHDFITKNALVIARSLIVLWWWGLIDIYANLGSQQLFWLLWIHIILRWWSYLYDFHDGKKIFHVGYYVTLVLLWIQLFRFSDRYYFIHYVMAFIVLTMAIYSSIVFLMSALGKKVDSLTKYLFFIMFNISVIILIYLWWRDDLHSAVVLAQVYLMALYVIIYGVGWYYDQIKDDVVLDEEHLAEEILQGKRVLGRRVPFIGEAVVTAQSFLNGLDKRTSFSMSFMNIVLVVIQLYLFVVWFSWPGWWMIQVIFWFWLSAFFVNYLLLREIWFSHQLQRAVAFVLLNFWIYLSIIQWFGANIYRIVILWIARSLFNSLLIFLSSQLRLDILLQKQDFIIWIWTTILSTIVNMYFILRLPLSGQFRFSVMFVYMGLQSVFILYALRRILRKQTPLNIEQQVEKMIQDGMKNY